MLLVTLFSDDSFGSPPEGFLITVHAGSNELSK